MGKLATEMIRDCYEEIQGNLKSFELLEEKVHELELLLQVGKASTEQFLGESAVTEESDKNKKYFELLESLDVDLDKAYFIVMELVALTGMIPQNKNEMFIAANNLSRVNEYVCIVADYMEKVQSRLKEAMVMIRR